MSDYIQCLCNDLPGDMDGTSTVIATEHLFSVNRTNPELLMDDEAELFHHYVARLFLRHRARLDLQTTVVFLTT